VAGSLVALGRAAFRPLNSQQALRLAIPSALGLTPGFEIVPFSFFLSVLGMSRK